MKESGQQFDLLSRLSNMGYYFNDSGSLLDNGDHTPAQLQEHLLLIGSQAVMISALMEQRIAGILGAAGQVIQRYLQNLCNIEQQRQTGLSGTALNVANGFHCHADLFGQFIGIHLLHFSRGTHSLTHQNRTNLHRNCSFSVW